MAHRLSSSSVSLPHEYRSNGRAAIYPFLYMLRLSVVCSITTYLTFPILILNFSGEYTISTDIDNLTFHVSDSRPSLNTRAPTLGYTTRLCSVSPRSARRDHHTWIQSLFILLVYGITHDTSSPITVSWSSPLEKHP